MNDPIKAALDAAARVMLAEGIDALLPGEGLREQWMQEPPHPEGLRQCALVVAAFLRALPDAASATAQDQMAGVVWLDSSAYYEPMAWVADKLADAVERAACVSD